MRSLLCVDHEESSEIITKGLKSSKNSSPKGILKSQDIPDRNCSCSKNSMIHAQAQKAITFSQRQMQDIENIAARLLKGLASMKHIVMESVGSEACSSASSNFPPEEVNIANLVLQTCRIFLSKALRYLLYTT